MLDVAAGTGNVAIRAAEAGAEVVAADLTPEHFAAGRREARARGVELDWVEADAEALPFGDDEFDVVTSCLGAIFAPDHRAVAGELVRVCRPGGTIGMVNFTPEGLGGDFFALFGRHAPPPPPGALAARPVGQRGARARAVRRPARRAGAARAELRRAQPRPGRLPRLLQGDVRSRGRASTRAWPARPTGSRELDRDFLAFATEANQGPAGGPAEYPYEYLLVVGRKRAA